MRGFEIVAIVIGVFFVIGIAVGKLLAVRFPARGMRWNRRNRGRYMDGGAPAGSG